MSDPSNTPQTIETVLDGDDPIELGYEAAAPWLQAHCRPGGEMGRELATREALRTLMTGSLA